MSGNKHKNAHGNNPGASIQSKKSPGASIRKSKFGTVRGTQYGAMRFNMASSANKNTTTPGDASKPYKAPVQIFDEVGTDMTPLPLYTSDPHQAKQKQSTLLADGSVGAPTDHASQVSIYNTGTVNTSTFGAGPFSRSVFSQAPESATQSMVESDEADQVLEVTSAWGEIRHKREEVKVDLKEADLEKIVDLTFNETTTIWLLDIQGICVSTESEEAQSVYNNNEAYQELIKNRQGNDKYAERGMNTFNEPQKYKLIQTSRITYNEAGIYATNWDMYDAFQLLDKDAIGKRDDEEGTISQPSSPREMTESLDKIVISDAAVRDKISSSVRIDVYECLHRTKLCDDNFFHETYGARNFSPNIQSESHVTFSSTLFADSDSVSTCKDFVMASAVLGFEEDKILQSEKFKNDLFIMERVINLNTYQAKQALYRGFTIMKDIDKEGAQSVQQLACTDDIGPNFDRLWSYSCKSTQGRNVSCLTWNKTNPDLIAVGYGQFEFSNQKEGLLMCWSLKNPEYPERVYTCKEGVLSADFSRANPSLLAVGLYDGSVVVYNVRQGTDEPILDNFFAQGKHTAPMWQVKWVEKERGSGEEAAEVLVSVSTDGRVCQWSIRKEFECYDLMKFKKIPTRMGGKKEKKEEAFISKHAGGLCFDFNNRDSNIYLAGTEEGHIHKCSCSYNEQFLESYFGHSGPIYKIEWSPFVSDIFLSCSADWSIRLWHQDNSRPILNFFSSTKPVYDIAWSPKSSTVFACVSDGAVEVWDLSLSILDPIIVNNPISGAKPTSVTFSRNSDCLLVGDSEGQVTVLQLRSMPVPPLLEKQADALFNVIHSSLAGLLQNQAAGEQSNLADKEESQLKDDLGDMNDEK